LSSTINGVVATTSIPTDQHLYYAESNYTSATGASAPGTYSVAIGDNSQANGLQAYTVGVNSISNGNQSFVLGINATNDGSSNFLAGLGNVTDGSSNYNHLVGNYLNANSSNNESYVLGRNTNLSGNSYLGGTVFDSSVNSAVESVVNSFSTNINTLTRSFVDTRNSTINNSNFLRVIGEGYNLTDSDNSIFIGESTNVVNFDNGGIVGNNNNFTATDYQYNHIVGNNNTFNNSSFAHFVNILGDSNIYNSDGKLSNVVGYANTFNATDETGVFGQSNTVNANASYIFGIGNTTSVSDTYVIGKGLNNTVNSTVDIGTNDTTKLTIESNGRLVLRGPLSPSSSGNDGTTGQFLMSQGAGVAPAWANAGTGLSLNGISWSTQPSQTFAVGTSGTNFNISSTGSVHTFNIPNASLVNRGLVSTGTQAFVGDKTFNGQVAVTNCGTSTNIYCNNGNSFGTLATLGTLDANDQRFVTNGTERTRSLNRKWKNILPILTGVPRKNLTAKDVCF
jgi:hypothetical protein